MDKTVGKAIYFLILMCSTVWASVRLEVKDVDGNSTNQIGVGQPFTLDISIDGVQNAQVKPEITGLDNCYWRNNGVMITSINGHTKIKHKYRARFDSPGFYVIGPAKVNDNGHLLVSNTVGVTVSEQQASVQKDQTNKDQANTQNAFLKLTADKDRVVLGERIKCSVRFYYGSDVTNLAPINQQEIPGFTLMEGNQAERGTETINGKQYNYIDLQWSMSPNEVGKKTIPAYHADFTMRSQAHRNMNHLSMFLSTFGEQKRIYSNALTITVAPLPAHDGPVHAIGNFTAYAAKLEPAVAKEGEGMVLTLELEGSGNLNNNILTLDMPDSFKYYDSKNYLAQTQGANNKYCFEFIVQGLQKGDWEIKPQKFTFFDTKSRKYKTLETLPLTVSIMPSLNANKKFVQPVTKQSEATSTALHTVDEIRPINQTGMWYKTDSRNLPLWLLLLLAILPIMGLFFLWFKSYFNSSVVSSGRNQKNAFKNAYAQLEAANKSQNIKLLHPLFVDLFTARYQISPSQATQEFMREQLVQAKVSSAELEAWDSFINQLSEHIFFARPARSDQFAVMYQYARQWINKLEKII